MKENKFSDLVYNQVLKIPKGSVATYGQIAMLCGSPKAARAVGNALHNNPFFKVIPCHRVVNHNGYLAENFVFGGKEIQKKYLEDEGINVDINYKVNLSKYLWTI